MKRVIVLCPESVAYRDRAFDHARALGDAPIWGGEDAYPWLPVAHAVAAYVDHGISTGMSDLITCARAIGVPVEHRTIAADAWAAVIRDLAFPDRVASQ